MDITETCAPRSDQLNAEDLLTGPRTFTVEKVTRGSAEQPVEIHLVEFPGRPFKPSKTVRRILVAAWGPEASNYAGRRMTLYRDPDVKFGGMDVGGIRVSHLSHIDRTMKLALAETRAKRKVYIIEPLPDVPSAASRTPNPAKIIEAFAALKVTTEQLELKVGADHEKWTADDIATLAALGKAIKAGETTVYEEFEPQGEQAQESEPVQGELA
ncbi:hypothetical protein [Mycolicibacterium poriferae]|jgi:hypothetical protein|uniref:hypothetical protein n=1 Tax=Mycolicibacterium poriferae TaxID=39694 RepID=UPI0024BB8689|nr:hypothetical protein [Mycolicibacterium poriferae]